MTVTATRPVTDPATETQADLILLPSEMYAVPDNPWRPWVLGAGGVALGSCTATVVTILLASPLVWWALASTVTLALLFAWTVAGHVLFEKRDPAS